MESSPSLSEPIVGVLRALRRRWLGAVAVLLVCVAAATVIDLKESKAYKATAVVYLSPTSLASQVAGAAQPATDSLSLARTAQTQASIAESAGVAQDALVFLRSHALTPAQLLAESVVAPEPNANLLDFSVTDRSPSHAVRLANALAQAYIRFRVTLDTEPIKRAIKKLTAAIKALRPRQTSSGLYSNLVEKQQSLQSLVDLATGNATLVKTAISAPKVRPRTAVNIALGVLLGLLLALVSAVLLDRFDTRLRTEADISDALGLPLLARLSPPPASAGHESQLIALADPRAAEAEEFRLMRANLEFAGAALDSHRTLLFSSAQAAEGKSTTVANLAVTLSRLGKRVIVIDLDFRRPRLAYLFSTDTKSGLSDVISGSTTLDAAITTVALHSGGEPTDDVSPDHGTSSIRLLDTGATPFNVGDFLALPQVTALIQEVADSGEFDYVLIDTPPMVQFADALSVLDAVDAVVVVARINDLGRPAAAELQRLIKATSTPCLGFVLTGATEGIARDPYGYGYGSYASRGTPARQDVGAPERVETA